MIKRKITKEIKTLAKEFPIVVILGPRQSGKTTIAKHIFKKYDYVSMEDYDQRIRAIEDPRGFLEKYKENVIIDEIQRVPELFSYLQTHTDALNKNGSFVLTGSHNYLLMENITQSLAGRVGIATLFPLSLEEMDKRKNENVLELIFNGMYPRIIDQNIRPSSFYKTYVNTYLEKDIRLIKNIVDYGVFLRFLKLLAGRCGQILNVQTIAEDVGVSVKTVNEWISVLETSYIIYKLPPYYNNYNKRIIKHPKIYFYDMGLVCYLLEFRNFRELDGYYQYGNIFENFIINEFVKYSYNLGDVSKLYFWKDNHSNEVDLIMDGAKDLQAFEIKAGQTFRKEFLKNLIKFDAFVKNKRSISKLIYGGKETIKFQGIKILSWKELYNFKNVIKFISR